MDIFYYNSRLIALTNTSFSKLVTHLSRGDKNPPFSGLIWRIKKAETPYK